MDPQPLHSLLVLYLLDHLPPWLRKHREDRLYAQEKGVSLDEYRQRTSALSAQLNQIFSRTSQWQQWSRKDRAVLFRDWHDEAFGGEVFVAELQKMSPQGLGRMLDRYTAIPPNSARRGSLLGSGVVAYRAGAFSDPSRNLVRESFSQASLWQLWPVTDQEDLVVHLYSQLPQHEREELVFLLRYMNYKERDALLDLMHPLSSQERFKLLHEWLSSSLQKHDYSSRFLTPFGKPLLAFLVE